MNKIAVATAIIVICLLLAGVATHFISPVAQNVAFLSFTLYYADGTPPKTYYPNTAGQLAMVDVNSGKQAMALQYSLSATPTFISTGVANWSVSATMKPQLIKKDYGLVYTGSIITASPTGTSLTSGVAITVYQSPMIYVDNFRMMYPAMQTGQQFCYEVVLNSFTMTITMTDGAVLTKTAIYASMAWNFQYVSEATFTGLTVTFTTPTLT